MVCARYLLPWTLVCGLFFTKRRIQGKSCLILYHRSPVRPHQQRNGTRFNCLSPFCLFVSFFRVFMALNRPQVSLFVRLVSSSHARFIVHFERVCLRLGCPACLPLAVVLFSSRIRADRRAIENDQKIKNDQQSAFPFSGPIAGPSPATKLLP